MNKLTGLALGTLLSFGAASSAWGAGEAPKQAGDPAIEEIPVAAKHRAPGPIVEFVITAKRPGTSKEARTPPNMPVEIPRLELAIPAPPAVRL